MNKVKSVKQKKVNKQAQEQTLIEKIYLGLDVHAEHIRVVRQLDEANPQPAQRLGWENIEEFCRKQTELCKKVYAVYEAGAFGYGLYRTLRAMGVECFVIRPCKLDPDHKRVQTDKTDARHLVDKLWRYTRGYSKAMSVVHVPNVKQEAERIESRHRQHLHKELQSMIAHGRGLLLFHGVRIKYPWWGEVGWELIHGQLSAELRSALEDCRKIIAQYETLLKSVEKKLEESAPEHLPVAMGALTYVLLNREIHDWGRFGNRRKVGSFLGLCGGVASSGPSHYDLSITKSGSPHLRALLVQLAWRMVRYQPEYHAVKKWAHILGPNVKKHSRHRKRAIVALARQLAVDIWKWQTGRITAEQLGWTVW